MTETMADNASIQPMMSFVMTFVMILAAEMGDKSQLVCMVMARKLRPAAVFAGALTAFALLNLVAVTLGALIARAVPHYWLLFAVAMLFSLFAFRAFVSTSDDRDSEPDAVDNSDVYGVFLTAFLMIFVSEFGDKTQIAVAGLSSAAAPLAVWFSATLSMAASTALAVWGSGWVLERVSAYWMQRLSGFIFLVLAIVAFSYGLVFMPA